MLTPAQEKILKTLAKRKNKVPAGPLHKAAGISYNYFQQTINELIEDKLVDYDTDESRTGRGRKPYVYWATKKGAAKVK